MEQPRPSENPDESHDAFAPDDATAADEHAEPSRVFLARGPWTVIVDMVFSPASKTSWLRVRGAFASDSGFRCRVSRRNAFDAVGKLFGMQDIEIGEPVFDAAFTIRSSDSAALTELLADARLRMEIDAQQAIMLEIGPSTEAFTVVGHAESEAEEDAVPSTVDEVVITLGADVDETHVVHRLVDVVATILERLVTLGIATRHRVHLARCPSCGHDLIDQPRCPECAQPVQPF